MTFYRDIPGTLTAQVPTVAHAAATATEFIASWEAPDNITVVSHEWRPSAAITGTATNYTNLNLINAGTGAGTTELGNLDFDDDLDATAGEVKELYATEANYSEGNLFKLQAEKVSSGLAIPSGVWVIKYRNR